MPLLVLGMHRSGTSAATRVIAALGVEVGAAELLMGPAPSNQTGHWEITHLTELNDELLRELGGRWSAPPSATAAERAALASGPWGERAKAAIDETFESDDWVWKDPRVCLLLPFWRTVIGDGGLRVVLVVRDPSEVAGSLEDRNEFSVAYGIALWERHLRESLEGIAGLPVHVVRYGDLLADPVATACELATFLDRPAPADEAAIAALVDPAIRHQRGDDPEPLSAEADALRALVDGLTGSHETFEVAVGPETPNLQLAFDEHARLSLTEDMMLQQRPLVDEAIQSRDRIAALEKEVRVLRRRLERIENFWIVRAGRAVRRTFRRLRSSGGSSGHDGGG